MLRFTQRCSMLLIALSTLTCAELTGPGNARHQLDVNQQKWSAHNFKTYAFTFHWECFCPPIGTVVINVANDSVMRAFQPSTGDTVTTLGLPTIHTLFETVRHALDNGEEVHATYDSILGFPTEIVVPGDPRATDSGARFVVSSVSPPASTTAGLSRTKVYGTAPAAPARRGSAPAVTRPFSMRTAAP